MAGEFKRGALVEYAHEQYPEFGHSVGVIIEDDGWNMAHVKLYSVRWIAGDEAITSLSPRGFSERVLRVIGEVQDVEGL